MCDEAILKHKRRQSRQHFVIAGLVLKLWQVHAGLSAFFKSLFTHSPDSPEVYCAKFKELEGRTFG
jgi:hypothetical protein